MGKSSSSSNQTITNNTVNKNYMDSLNKTIMNSAVSTMINNASTCSSSVNQNNNCSFNNSTVSGNLSLGGTQDNKAKVNFSCIQATQTSADMATAMVASMAAEMKALSGTDAAAQLNNASQSSNKTGFGATGGSSSSSANTNVTNNVTNETITHVENIFQQNLSNNFTSNTVNECIGKTTQSNNISASGVTVGGSANISCNQSNTLEQVQECKQLSEAINKTTQKTFQELGIKTEVANTTTSKTEATTTSKSENVSTGPIQDIGNAISGILGSIMGFASFAALGPILGPICCLCSFIIGVCLILIIAKSIMGEGYSSSSSSIGSIGASAPDYSQMSTGNNSLTGGSKITIFNFTSDSM
jgi:hypothetical protein